MILTCPKTKANYNLSSNVIKVTDLQIYNPDDVLRQVSSHSGNFCPIIDYTMTYHTLFWDSEYIYHI